MKGAVGWKAKGMTAGLSARPSKQNLAPLTMLLARDAEDLRTLLLAFLYADSVLDEVDALVMLGCRCGMKSSPSVKCRSRSNSDSAGAKEGGGVRVDIFAESILGEEVGDAPWLVMMVIGLTGNTDGRFRPSKGGVRALQRKTGALNDGTEKAKSWVRPHFARPKTRVRVPKRT